MAQEEQEKVLKGYQEAEALAAEAALREREKALTNYQSAEAVSCCGPLRSCRHRKRWAALPKKGNFKLFFSKKRIFRNILFLEKNISKYFS